MENQLTSSTRHAGSNPRLLRGARMGCAKCGMYFHEVYSQVGWSYIDHLNAFLAACLNLLSRWENRHCFVKGPKNWPSFSTVNQCFGRTQYIPYISIPQCLIQRSWQKLNLVYVTCSIQSVLLYHRSVSCNVDRVSWSYWVPVLNLKIVTRGETKKTTAVKHSSDLSHKLLPVFFNQGWVFGWDLPGNHVSLGIPKNGSRDFFWEVHSRNLT